MSEREHLLGIADDELVLGWRDSEWTGIAPILEAVHNLVEALGEHRGAPLRQITQMLVLTALGDGLIGGPIADALKVPRVTARATVAHQLRIMRGW